MAENETPHFAIPTAQDCKVFEKQMPELWRQLYPRIYTHSPRCGEYASPKAPACVFMIEYTKATSGALGFQGITKALETPCMILMRTLRDCSMPQVWMTPQITQAIQQTTPPFDLDWTEMPLPFPAMTFMVPKGTLVHPTEGNVLFISYGRTSGTAPDGTPEKNFFIVTHMEKLATLISVYTGRTTPIVPLGNLTRFQSEFKGIIEPLPKLAGFEIQLDRDDTMVEKEALHLLFGALLMMNARPNLVTESKLTNRIPQRREAPKEFWTPRLLGEHYKIRHESVDHGGHHSSPRFHWVRGHWRDQPHGPGRELRHTIWIEPFTKGVTADESHAAASEPGERIESL
jgi:hypothetical protein